MTVEQLLQGMGLLEGPVWTSEGLVFSDASEGGLWRLPRDGGYPEVVLPHRRGMSGVAAHESGAYVVSGRNVAIKSPDVTAVVFDSDPSAGRGSFNDLTTDRLGRVYVGSLAGLLEENPDPDPGKLHMIDLDGTEHTLADDVLLSNGLAFSPSGDTLYHADSIRRMIWAYDIDEAGLSTRRWAFVTFDDSLPAGSLPDGMAVDQEGQLWVAVAHGGCVVTYSPSGQEVSRVELPTPMVTSLCFGGDDLRTLYVTSGPDQDATTEGGGIYRLHVEVPGLPVAPARIRPAIPAS